MQALAGGWCLYVLGDVFQILFLTTAVSLPGSSGTIPGLVTVHSLPFLPQPRFSPSESPWWKASDVCQDIDLASDLRVVNQKVWKPEQKPRAGTASHGQGFLSFLS